MSALGWISGRRGVVAGVSAQALAIGAVAAVLVTAHGYPSAKVDLNDSGVWTVKQDTGQIARVIASIPNADAALHPAFFAANDDSDVLQDGGNVLAWDRAASKAAVVDPSSGQVQTEVALPPAAQVAVGGALAVILDPAGYAWFGPTADTLASDFSAKDKAPLSPGAGSSVALGLDGTLAVASPISNTVALYRWADTGLITGPTSPLPSGGIANVTLVGAGADFGDVKPVVAMADGRVVLPGGAVASMPADSAGVQVQWPGPASDSVLVATDRSLVSVPLSGGGTTTVFDGGTGQAARPVVVGTCGVGAWSDTPLVAHGCGVVPYTSQTAFDGKKNGVLVLRANRGFVVVNDPRDGRTALADTPQDDLVDWAKAQLTLDPLSADPGAVQKKLKLDAVPQPIATRPDHFGVRPGGSALMRVLANDDNTNNLVLRVENPDLSAVQPTAAGSVTTVDSGKAVQFTAPTTASGAASFTYVATDGKAKSKPTLVSVDVVTGTTNTEPKLLVPTSHPTLQVPVHGTASYSVLDDWYDFEGDAMVLTCDSATDGVRCAPDGTITVRGSGDTARTIQVKYHVNDGRKDAPTAGSLRVDLIPVDGAAPVARPDYVLAVLGKPTTIRPLVNDTGFGAGSLTLSIERPVDGLHDNGDGTLTFTPHALGSVIAYYRATSSNRPNGYTVGAIRIDVVKPDPTAKPIASPDDAAVRDASTVLVDVLANDFDPSGGLLMVSEAHELQAVGQVTASVAVQIIDGRILRITALPGFTGSDRIAYTATNGSNSATSIVTLREIKADVPFASPLAVDDSVTVQAGAAVSVPVLANDSDPEGGALVLQAVPTTGIGFRPEGLAPNKPMLSPDSAWTAFRNGDLVTLVAPPKPGLVLISYSVRSQNGYSASATVKVTVTAPTTANVPAQPVPLEARIYKGQTVTIPAAASFDRAGFPVQLADPVSQPTPSGFGSVTLTSDGYAFTAGQSTGLATFGYQVRTASGALSPPSTVSVVIAARPPASAPVAVPDSIVARPGRAIDIDVLANDFSPSGQLVTLAGVVAKAGVRIAGSLVRVTVPKGSTAPISGTYTISTGAQTATGSFTVTPDTTAPLLPLVATTDTARAGVDATTSVPLLANDLNPNGTRDDLVVTAVQPAAMLVGGPGPTVELKRADVDRYAWYTITGNSEDHLTAQGLILVPGTAKRPQAVTPPPRFELKEDGPARTLDITKYATSPAGRPLRLVPGKAPSGSLVKASSTGAQQVTVVVNSAAGLLGSVQFFVTDLPDGQPVPDSLVASITVPITINRTPPDPVMLATNVTVPNDGTASPAIDLRPLLDPADPRATLTFSNPASTSPALHAALTKSSLVLTAEGGLKPGPYQVTYDVTSAGARHKGKGTVNVTVTLVPPPPLQPCPAMAISNAKVVTLDLTQCVSASYTKASTLIFDASLPPGSGKVTSISGSHVTLDVSEFVANQRTNSLVDLSYQVTDAAKNNVSGHWLINVYGRPGAPTIVSVQPVEKSGGVADVLWTEPQNKGGVPDLIYTLEATSQTTGHRVKGDAISASRGHFLKLEPDELYSFVVTATNPQNQAATPSAPYRVSAPFDVPPTVTGVIATKGNATATVSWSIERNGGTAIKTTFVTATPAPTGFACNSVTVPGPSTGSFSVSIPLVNGCSYQFSVDVTNRNGLTGSGVSVDYYDPFGPILRDTVPVPRATLRADGSGKTIDVSWDPSTLARAANGTMNDHAIEVVVALIGGSTTVQPSGANTGHSIVQVPDFGDYTIALRVTNTGGKADTGPTASVRAAGTPETPTNTSATLGDTQATVTYSLGAANGVRWDHVIVTASPGSATASGSVTGTSGGPGTATFTPGSLTNGVPYTFTVVGCNEQNCSTASGPSNSVVPFGAPRPPAVTVEPAGGNNVKVTITNGWGNGLSATVAISLNGGGITGGGCPPSVVLAPTETINFSCIFQGGFGQTYSATATLTQSQTGKVLATTSGQMTIPVPKTSWDETVTGGAGSWVYFPVAGDGRIGAYGVKAYLIPKGGTVQVSCRGLNQAVASSNVGGWWYKVIGPSPYGPGSNGASWTAASNFNAGTGAYPVDNSVPQCP